MIEVLEAVVDMIDEIRREKDETLYAPLRVIMDPAYVIEQQWWWYRDISTTELSRQSRSHRPPP